MISDNEEIARLKGIAMAAAALETALQRIGSPPDGEIGCYRDPVWDPEAIDARDALRVALGLPAFNTPEDIAARDT